jgi:RHS repeat-associated protein
MSSFAGFIILSQRCFRKCCWWKNTQQRRARRNTRKDQSPAVATPTTKNDLWTLNIAQENEYYAFGLRTSRIETDNNTTTQNRYLYNGKELQDDTEWEDYGARMYNAQNGRWTTIDPLAEISRRYSPFVYGNNNPLRFIDPDGMQAQTIYDFNGNAHNVGDNEQKNVYKSEENGNGENKNGDPLTAENVNTAANYDKLKTGTNVKSGIYSGTKLEGVAVKAKKWTAEDEVIFKFRSLQYNRQYFPRNPNDHNDYGPYNPDAVAFSMSFNASGYMWSGSFDVGFAMSSEGFAVFASDTYGLGGQIPGLGIGGSFSMIDKYGGQKSVFDGMAGESIGWDANAVFSGGYSTSAQMINGAYGKAPNGVESISIGLRPSIGSWGLRGTYSNTKWIKPLWQK